MVRSQIGDEQVEREQENAEQDNGSVAGQRPGAAVVESLAQLLRHIRRLQFKIGAEFYYMGDHCPEIAGVGHTFGQDNGGIVGQIRHQDEFGGSGVARHEGEPLDFRQWHP